MPAYCHKDDPEDLKLYWIFRLMIDISHQGEGIGYTAVQLAINEMKNLGAKRIRTMHKPSNELASSFFEKLGFERTGLVLDDGDIVRELNVQHTDSCGCAPP